MSNPQPLRIGPFQSDLLDLSRWVAALLVVVEHLRSLMFLPYGTEAQLGVPARAFYFLTGFGHPAVMIFFVMSGFLVGGKVLERLALGTFSWQKYVIDRSSRLYAVYFFALILGAILDTIGYHFLDRFGLYDRSYSGTMAVVNHDFHATLTPSIFGLNLVMCQTILVPVFGSNGPLWSLANEFWYYLAGPILFSILFIKRWRSVILSTLALALLFWFLPAGILIYSLVWFMGAALYFINGRSWLPLWLSLPLFLASFSLARMQAVTVPYVTDFLIGLSFATVINSAAGKSQHLPWRSLSRKAADFSYSVYLCHFPFLIFVLSALYQATGMGLRQTASGGLYGLFVAILLLIYVWSYTVSLFTERQTPRIRSWLYRLAGQPPMLKAEVTARAGQS